MRELQEVSTTNLRQRLAEVLKDLPNRWTVVTRHAEPIAVLLSFDDLYALVLEDEEVRGRMVDVLDIFLVSNAKRRQGDRPDIPWEKVRYAATDWSNEP